MTRERIEAALERGLAFQAEVDALADDPAAAERYEAAWPLACEVHRLCETARTGVWVQHDSGRAAAAAALAALEALELPTP